MSSAMRFEKTFSRKKKEKEIKPSNDQEKDVDDEQVLSTLQAISKKAKASKNLTSNVGVPETSKKAEENPEKGTPSKPPKQEESKLKVKNNVGSSSQNQNPSNQKKKQNPDKQQTQKQKSKVENGKVEKKEGEEQLKIMSNGTKSPQNQNQSKPKKQNPEKPQTPKQKRKVENGGGEKEVKKKKKKAEGKVEEEVKKEESSECTFATNRIVRIIKSEGSDYRLSQEAVFLINKATEKFIEFFSEDAYDFAVQDQKSFIAYKHLSTAVSQEKRFDFLSDFVPEKVVAEKALAERKPAETLRG